MEERRSDIGLIKRIDKLEKGHTVLLEKIDANTEMTAELLDLFKTAKGGLRTVTWVGNFIKWIGGIALTVIGLYVAYQQWKNGQ